MADLYLGILRDPNKFQSFNVVNDGRGNFIVTGIGPAKETAAGKKPKFSRLFRDGRLDFDHRQA